MPDNNALERTRRVGVPASRAIVRVSPRRSTQCSTDVDERTLTAVGTSKRICDFAGCTEILVGSTPSNPRGSYGGIPVVASGAQVVTVGTPWLGWIGSGQAWRGSEHPKGQSEALGPTNIPSNNGMHQTGRGGVALAVRRGPVVEARPAGDAGCSTVLGWRKR
jgi:hypothetical protein